MEQQIMTILNQICGTDDGDLETDLDLFEAGLLDSFGVVQLLVELEEQFHVTLDIAMLTREDIATPALIVQQVRQAG